MSQDIINSKILNKIQKLLDLSNNNSNENEAATAFGQAQALLSKYRLSMAEVEAASATFSAGEQVIQSAKPLYVGERVVHWKSFLADSIAKFNGCKMFVNFKYMCADCGSAFVKNNNNKSICSKCGVYVGHKKQSRYVVVGRPSDIEIVDYLFHSVVQQIETLCKTAMQNGYGVGKTFSNNFKHAATDTVVGRLRSAHQEVRKEYAGSAAMVLVDKKDAEVQKWMDDNVGKLRPLTIASRTDHSARDLGRQADHKVSLNKGIKGSGSGGGLLS